MSKILIFGATGGIGKEVIDILEEQYSHDVVGYSRDDLDFQNTRERECVSNELDVHMPDYIINCSGLLGENDWSYEEVYNVNVGSNWEIIKYCINNPEKRMNVMMIGSSAYAGGRKNYMLYSSSKAALHNLWEGASENLESTRTNLGIFHFGPVMTDMIPDTLRKENKKYLDARTVAENIVQATLAMDMSRIYKIL